LPWAAAASCDATFHLKTRSDAVLTRSLAGCDPFDFDQQLIRKQSGDFDECDGRCGWLVDLLEEAVASTSVVCQLINVAKEDRQLDQVSCIAADTLQSR